MNEQTVSIAGLYVHPVKSCARIGLERVLVTETGLEWDRQWMVVDEHGTFVSQREEPRLALVRPTLRASDLMLRAPGMLALHLALDAIEKRHGVDAATLVAVFGVETDYGRVANPHPVVDATLSRACLNLKSADRKLHFFAALWLLQEGVVQRDEFKGSWAGAFGLTQFMPDTYVRYMRDDPGAPPSDIIGSIPGALETTARYLRALGWSTGLPWGVEVNVPPELGAWHAPENEHACLLQARPAGKCRSITAWSSAASSRICASLRYSSQSTHSSASSKAICSFDRNAGRVRLLRAAL